MKVAILGGGGLRAPLLARALAGSGLGVRELALFDVDRGRLRVIAPLAQALAPGLRVRVARSAPTAVRGARFVFAAIRAGGQEARAHDERTCVEAGVLGQETVGAAGAALAMRNIPAMLRLAETVAREAPDAVLINYTNPAGLVTEAVRNETPVTAYGICDTPAGLTERIVRLLYLDPDACVPGWSGINHLGWLTGLYASEDRGEGADANAPPAFPPDNVLFDLYRDPDRLARVHPDGLFDAAEMAGAIPSEYVFLHLHPERAVARAQAAGATRGDAILGMEAALFHDLRQAEGDPERARHCYEQYLAARSASYFGIEARGDAGPPPEGARESDPGGYDRIGLALMRGLTGASDGARPTTMVVNTRNRTSHGGPAVPELPAEDVVEVAARVSADGVDPIPQPPLPVAAAALLRRVKAAEREFVRAAVAGVPAVAAEALREHPAGGPAAAEVFRRLRKVAEAR